jgi:hypothetical protein
MDLRRAHDQSQIALARLQAAVHQQSAALEFHLKEQKASATAAAAATAAALKSLHDAADAAKKQQKVALQALEKADAAAIAHVKSDAESKIAAVRKAAAAASAAIAVQATATHDLNEKLKGHISVEKALFNGVNKAIDQLAHFKAVPGPHGPVGPQGCFCVFIVESLKVVFIVSEQMQSDILALSFKLAFLLLYGTPLFC